MQQSPWEYRYIRLTLYKGMKKALLLPACCILFFTISCKKRDSALSYKSVWYNGRNGLHYVDYYPKTLIIDTVLPLAVEVRYFEDSTITLEQMPGVSVAQEGTLDAYFVIYSYNLSYRGRSGDTLIDHSVRHDNITYRFSGDSLIMSRHKTGPGSDGIQIDQDLRAKR